MVIGESKLNRWSKRSYWIASNGSVCTTL